MGLETATFISELVNTNPVGTDTRSQGDDHFRLLKSVLQSQFPNLTAAAVNPSVAEFNLLVGRNTLRDAAWSAANGGMIDDIQSLVDPNVDRILFWDDTAGAVGILTPASLQGLRILATNLELHVDGLALATLAAADRIPFHDSGVGVKKFDPTDLHAILNHDSFLGFLAAEHLDWTADQGASNINSANILAAAITQHQASIDHDALANFIADEHVAHGGVSINAGIGLSGGGNIQVSRTIDLNVESLPALTGPIAATDDYTINDGTTVKKIQHQALNVPSVNDADSHTFVNADFNAIRYYTGAGGHTWTVPTGIGQDDTSIGIINSGSAKVTMAGSGVTINSASGDLAVSSKGKASLTRESSTVYFLSGDLEA